MEVPLQTFPVLAFQEFIYRVVYGIFQIRKAIVCPSDDSVRLVRPQAGRVEVVYDNVRARRGVQDEGRLRQDVPMRGWIRVQSQPSQQHVWQM